VGNFDEQPWGISASGVMFGAVPSDSTVYQTFRHQMDAATLAGVWEMAGIRAQVWRRSSETNTGESVILDIDAKLVEVHSENKEGTAPTYKRGFGSHPMLCFADATGEALAARLRPGNAGANTVTDHLGVLDDAVAQLPPELTAGHRPGDDPDTVARQVVVRTDSAGCTQGFVWGCQDRNIGIRRLKDSGLCRFPFTSLDANRAWLATVLCRRSGPLVPAALCHRPPGPQGWTAKFELAATT
jgi:Transposase DDE domain group 1